MDCSAARPGTKSIAEQNRTEPKYSSISVLYLICVCVHVHVCMCMYVYLCVGIVFAAQTRAPVHVDSDEIWLRSWRYHLPSLNVAATAPLPRWALVLSEEQRESTAEFCSVFDAAVGKDTANSCHAGVSIQNEKSGGVSSNLKLDHHEQQQQEQELKHDEEEEEQQQVPPGRHASGVFMLYTDKDSWAPYKDFQFFKKKLPPRRKEVPVTVSSDGNDRDACTDDEHRGDVLRRNDEGDTTSLNAPEEDAFEHDTSGNVQYVPGLKHAFPLSESRTDIVVNLLARHLQPNKWKVYNNKKKNNIQQAIVDNS
jgi:hypothetical protein